MLGALSQCTQIRFSGLREVERHGERYLGFECMSRALNTYVDGQSGLSLSQYIAF